MEHANPGWRLWYEHLLANRRLFVFQTGDNLIDLYQHGLPLGRFAIVLLGANEMHFDRERPGWT
jgi:hypothetical protein